jgi:hypothetical protein
MQPGRGTGSVSMRRESVDAVALLCELIGPFLLQLLVGATDLDPAPTAAVYASIRECTGAPVDAFGCYVSMVFPCRPLCCEALASPC